MTKKEYLMAIANIEAVKNDAELSTFVAHEIEMLEKRKKAPKKPTQKQIENEAYKKAIIDFIDSSDKERFTVGELVANVPECVGLSAQKVNALVKQLVDANMLERNMEKRVAYFNLK